MFEKEKNDYEEMPETDNGENQGEQTVEMPEDIKKKCSMIIHFAAVLSGTAGAIPIPIADSIPIGAIQISMVISLGKVFDLAISKSLAKSIVGLVLAPQVGRFIFANALKLVPGAGSIAGAATAVGITEALGWMIAYDFYKISIGQNPDWLKAISDATNVFKKYKNGNRRGK